NILNGMLSAVEKRIDLTKENN
ncbi:TPA: rRNA methyltransferase, partial [Haemophilus influenzae]